MARKSGGACVLYGSIALVLFSFWLVLSGHYTMITVPAGIFSVLGVVALSRRMGIADEEGHPIHLVPRALTYWPSILPARLAAISGDTLTV